MLRRGRKPPGRSWTRHWLLEAAKLLALAVFCGALAVSDWPTFFGVVMLVCAFAAVLLAVLALVLAATSEFVFRGPRRPPVRRVPPRAPRRTRPRR